MIVRVKDILNTLPILKACLVIPVPASIVLPLTQKLRPAIDVARDYYNMYQSLHKSGDTLGQQLLLNSKVWIPDCIVDGGILATRLKHLTVVSALASDTWFTTDLYRSAFGDDLYPAEDYNPLPDLKELFDGSGEDRKPIEEQ